MFLHEPCPGTRKVFGKPLWPSDTCLWGGRVCRTQGNCLDMHTSFSTTRFSTTVFLQATSEPGRKRPPPLGLTGSGASLHRGGWLLRGWRWGPLAHRQMELVAWSWKRTKLYIIEMLLHSGATCWIFLTLSWWCLCSKEVECKCWKQKTFHTKGLEHSLKVVVCIWTLQRKTSTELNKF